MKPNTDALKVYKLHKITVSFLPSFDFFFGVLDSRDLLAAETINSPNNIKF